MTCCYYYRFQFPYKSVDAMANIKIASGCNFLGYYMFQGGSNPVGKHGMFMNEGQVPRISYDYQAALGEFGQVRESYLRLKSIHYFVNCFGERLCGLKTALPEGASDIDPRDHKTLRFAVRTDGKRGFLFINNYQDHAAMSDKKDEEVTLQLKDEEITWKISIAAEENAILPFHFDLDGIDLIRATAQPVLKTDVGGKTTYVFFVPDGMRAEFLFEDGVWVNGKQTDSYQCDQCCQCADGADTELFEVEKEGRKLSVLVVSRKLANQMFLLANGGRVFSEGAILEDQDGIRLETEKAVNLLRTYPADLLKGKAGVRETESITNVQILGSYLAETAERRPQVKVQKVAEGRYTLTFPENLMEGLKDARLQLVYSGDIGHAFLGNRMINDNFSNGAVWEIGLKDFAQELSKESMVIYITPLKEGVNVNVESAMAARREEAQAYVAELKEAALQPVYEIRLE